MQALVERGATVGVCDGLNQNALHAASFEGHAEIVKVLLDSAGVHEQLEAADTHGNTALTLASLRGHMLVMDALVEAGAR